MTAGIPPRSSRPVAGHRATTPPPAASPEPEPRVVYVQAPRRETSAGAVVSLIAGLLWLGGIGSLVALVVGFSSVKECREQDKAGDGMAVAGVLLGTLGLIATVLLIVAG